MILCTRGTDGSRGCTHDRGRFAIPGAVAVGTRSPINYIFQYTGHGPIVFRRNKQNSTRLAYPSFQLRDFGRRILLLVLVKRRNAIKLERFDSCAFRRKLSSSPSAARLYDPRRRLPAIPRIRIGVVICHQLTHSALLMNPKMLAQNLLQYFAGAALW